ncbi:ABC transporter ATP-binding protein [Paenibacillus xylanexedens]|uniref:ABC transporter ATP-binding protein n=1 Tax=Paenibacillus xylanexedens TaxID=528191 RepID=UPI0011A3251B|nr:ABC transporter ATP-binding protein [Paenibacillus xylanexedens]
MSNYRVSPENEAASPLLRLEELRTYYPIRQGVLGRTSGYIKAVDGINLDISAGETLGLVGESGCGKSSIGRTMLRLEPAHSGRIFFEGQDITNLSQHRMKKVRTKLQIIFQDPYSSLNPRKRVGDLISEPILAHRLATRQEAEAEVIRLLDLVGLPRSAMSRHPHEFSGGQRQRIGIARALSLKPKLIVCDEPVSALDVSIQAQILNLFRDLQQELNLTYVFIAHGLGAVNYISTRIAVMYLGKIVEIGAKEDVFSDAKHPYTRSLLTANPITHPRMREQSRFVLEGDVPSPANPPQGCRFHSRCPYAQAKCQEEEPQLADTGMPAHQVACHFPIVEGS